jgi:hypothetical protein
LFVPRAARCTEPVSQHIEIHMPFPPRISPDADAARRRAVLWARRHGLITGPVDERRFTSWDIAGLMARWAPLVTGPALDMVVDAVNVATILDDQFDGPLADRPDEVARACEDFHAVARATAPGTAPDGAGPLARAFAEVWARLCAGRSAYWQDREGGYWRWYFESYVEETRDRALDRVLPREEYLLQRQKSGLVYPMVGMTESAYGFEASRRTHELPVVLRMFELTADVVDTTNDLYSVEKEETRGDMHNLVTVLAWERGGTSGDHVAEVVALVESWCAEFVTLEQRLGEVCAAAGLSGAETAAAHRLADIMRSSMRGHLDWYAHTDRYASLIPVGEAAYTNLL